MKLRFHTKLSYGIGGAADNAFYTLFATYQLFFLTTVAGVNPAAAGTISAAGSIFEVFCGPVVGTLSDRTRHRLGKRRPFLLAAALPTVLSITFFFTRVDLPDILRFFYYLFMSLLVWFSFSLFYVPYITLGADLTEDYEERTALRSFAYVGNQFGMIMGMVAPSFLAGFLAARGYGPGRTWSLIGLLIGAVCSLALLICALTVKAPSSLLPPGREAPARTHLSVRGVLRDYIAIGRLRPVIFIIGASLLFLIANTFFDSALVYYLTYNLLFSESKRALVLLLFAVSGILFVPLIARRAAATDKTATFWRGMFASGLLAALLFLPGLGDLGTFSLLFTAGIILAYSYGASCYWQLMPSMLYDVCEAEELASGKSHAGSVISLQALSESIACAAGAQLLGIFLELAGFDELLAVQTDTTLTCIRACVTLIPGLLLVAVAGIARLHPINKNSYARIIGALEKQRAGEPVDLTEFADIYGRKKHD